MEFLPQEIVNEILLIVNKPTLYHASLVCKQWRCLSLKQIKPINTYDDFATYCEQGDRLSIVNSKIDKTWLEHGLDRACEGGHKELVELIITHGADGAYDWNFLLYNACIGGCKEIVELIIAKGADDWNFGLYGACQGGSKEVAELMIAKGADDFDESLYTACERDYKHITDLLIASGATTCYCGKSLRDH